MDPFQKHQYEQFKSRRCQSAEVLAREQCRDDCFTMKSVNIRVKAADFKRKTSSSKSVPPSKKACDNGDPGDSYSHSNTTFDPLGVGSCRKFVTDYGVDGADDNYGFGCSMDSSCSNCVGVCCCSTLGRSNVSSITDQHRSNVMAKIVLHLKERQLRRDNTPLTIDEILDETRQLHILNSTKRWLVAEGLPSNPKVDAVANGTKFMFKPPFKLTDGKSLMRLLKQYDLKGLGGIMGDDLYESLPNCQKYFAKYAEEIVCIERPSDKKKVYFYKDKSPELGIDDEFKRLWRTFNLDSLDNDDIHDDFERPKPQPKTKARRKRRLPAKLDNTHVSDILEDYDKD